MEVINNLGYVDKGGNIEYKNIFIGNSDEDTGLYISAKYIQQRIDEITAEIKQLTDGSMKTSFKLTALRATKKELKALLS